MKVRSCVVAVKAIPEFGEEGVEIDLPNSGIKSGGLELLDEVAINVFKVVHQLSKEGSCR